MQNRPSAHALAAAKINDLFPEHPALTDFGTACKFIGISRQTGDHWLMAKKFPVPIVRLGTRKIGVAVVALQYWLVDTLVDAGFERGADPFLTAPTPVSDSTQSAQKKRRGRPRNVAAAEVAA